MWSLKYRGMVASYLDHSLLVAIAWARLLLFGFLFGALLGFRDQLPSSEPLLFLSLAFGLYSLVVAFLLKNHQDRIARWLGGSLDTLTVMLAMVLLAMSTTPAQTTQSLERLGFLLVIPSALLHFGLMPGAAISMGVAGWFLLVHSLGITYLGGVQGLLVHAPIMTVFGVIVASVSQQVGQVRQARYGVLPGPNKSRELPPTAPTEASLMELPRALPASRRIRVYISEEQNLLRKAYETLLLSESSIDLVEVSGPCNAERAAETVAAMGPDVIIFGFKVLDPAAVEKLEVVRERCPSVPLVVLSAHYTARGVSALKEFSRNSSTSCAYLLKHTVDTAGDLTQVIWSVAHGRVILDPVVMDGLMGEQQNGFRVLQDLSPLELDILKWMSKGYQNQTIAALLHMDATKLQRHVDSILRKIGDCPAMLDGRVYAITQYLKATGALSSQDPRVG
jgi:DNA-binding NarL/FixJ family response regulator